MIDPVVLHRIEDAIEHETRARFDAPLRDGEAKYYYRELAYLGYTANQIGRATGWQTYRLQADLRARREYRRRVVPDAELHVEAKQATVEQRHGTILIHAPEMSLSIDGFPRELANFGRLVYGAATDQQESA